jgi:hypothetical protein
MNVKPAASSSVANLAFSLRKPYLSRFVKRGAFWIRYVDTQDE